MSMGNNLMLVGGNMLVKATAQTLKRNNGKRIAERGFSLLDGRTRVEFVNREDSPPQYIFNFGYEAHTHHLLGAKPAVIAYAMN